MGPYGKTMQKACSSGELRFQSNFGYDPYGNLTEWRSFDVAGMSEGYTLASSTMDRQTPTEIDLR